MKTSLVILLAFLATAAPSFGAAWWEPASPRVGDVVTIHYDPRGGPINPTVTTLWLHWGVYDPATSSWSTPPQAIWPPNSRLHTDHVAVQSPMTHNADTTWQVAIDFDTTVHDMAFVLTDGVSLWDNNNNHNWIINFVTPGTVSWWTPENPQPGATITIFYDCVPGALPNNDQNVTMHWGVNEASHGNWRLPPQAIWPAGTVAQGLAAETPMQSLGNGLFQLVIHTNDSINSLHYVTTDGTNWDNNQNRNWDIFLREPATPIYAHAIFRFDPRSAFATQFTGPVTALNLAGTFNGWSTASTPLTRRDAYGNFWGEVSIPAGALEYKFVVNGSNWQTDPDNPLTAAGGFNNSYMEAVLDSFPQIYDVPTGVNLVRPYQQAFQCTVKVRAGDVGPGLMGAPTLQVDGNAQSSSWNAASGTLTFQLVSNGAAIQDAAITAADSIGRNRTRHLAYGFKDSSYWAVDPIGDLNYSLSTADAPLYDLRGFIARERAGGDSIEFTVRFAGMSGTAAPLVMITMSTSQDAYGDIPGFKSELRVPDISNGIVLPLLNPSDSHFVNHVHNGIHRSGDLTYYEYSADLHVDAVHNAYVVEVATADLEDILGSYQSAWYFTCATYMPADSAHGYCVDFTSSTGGTEAPDALDAIFYHAGDIQAKLMDNYGLTRRATLDAPGRGVAQIAPADIGPHMQSTGAVCHILTQGAPTTNPSQNVTGRVTTGIYPVTGVALIQNDTARTVTLSGDTFTVAVTLREGDNHFFIGAVDSHGDTSVSPQMVFTLIVNHAPNAQVIARVQGSQCLLDASATTDPEQQTVTFSWTADPQNPSPVTLINANTAIASFTRPSVPGEYYFNLTARDPDNHTDVARTFYTVRGDSAHGFSNNEAADWATNSIIYEIFVRSYSAQGNLAGVTADLDRIAGLGVNCIWLMPIFEGPSDHGYEITDYYSIEQDYGTAQDLHNLVQAAHARGIKVILDMVLNHTGIGHPFMQDAIRHGRYSHYWNWYDRDANGNYTYYYDWSSLPNINLNNPETVKYFIDMCKYWIQQYDVDGYRCDVAWGPQQRSPQFWVQWRAELKKVKPEAMFLAEYGANNFIIFSNRFDQAFDWQLHHEVNASFSNWFPNIPNFNQLTDLITNYGNWWPAYKEPLRFMENHDETRFISVNTPEQTRLTSSFMMCMPGSVMLYAGQEVGTTSQRGTINWSQDPSGVFPHYYKITNARKVLPALRQGQFANLSNSQNSTCYSYARYGTGLDPVIWVGDFSAAAQVVTVTINPAQLGLHPDSSYIVSELLGSTHTTMTGAQLTSLTTSLSPYQSRIYVISDSIISVNAGERSTLLPKETHLDAAYPNPFNPTAILPLQLAVRGHVSLKIYDVLGREAATIYDGMLNAGEHQFVWDASHHGSGVYFAVLRTGSIQQVRKLVLMR
jgi:cyclomaltodextrinase / maltogenic alpha-amylase / neopullulanase